MVRVLGKFPGAFFEKYNDVYIFYIPVGKFLFLLLAPYSFVLAQEKIRSIAGAPLAGKGVAQPLDLNIRDTAVLQADYNIHDKEGGLAADAAVVIGKDFDDLYLFSKKKGEGLV